MKCGTDDNLQAPWSGINLGSKRSASCGCKVCECLSMLLASQHLEIH